MGKVRLYLRRRRAHTIRQRTIYLERLLAVARLGRGVPPVVQDCAVDTGASLSVFPERVWQRCSRDVQWLTPQEEAAIPGWCRNIGGVTGGTFPCRLGLLVVELFDYEGGRIGPREILAMFALDGGRMNETVLGIGGGSLANLRLELSYDRGEAFLEELLPPPFPPSP